MKAKIIIRLIWTVTILLSDALLQTHYEYINYTKKWDLYSGKTYRCYDRTEQNK